MDCGDWAINATRTDETVIANACLFQYAMKLHLNIHFSRLGEMLDAKCSQ